MTFWKTVRKVAAPFVVTLAMTAPVQAGDLPKTGANPPQPEYEVAYDRRFDLKATLVVDRTGASPVEMSGPTQLRLDLGLRAAEGAKAADLELTCKVMLVSAAGIKSAPVREGPCFTGPLPVGGGWVDVGEPVKFRPDYADTAGSGGVLVEVKAGRGPLRKLMVTYGWAPEG